MERRRVHSLTETKSAGQGSAITGTIEESNGINAHGLTYNFICEPENADANAHGTWSVWCLPRETTALPATSVAAFEAEGDNNVLWACGVWSASNQTPYTSPTFRPKTSRNCPNGTRIVGIVTQEGVSAGVVRVDHMLCYFTRSL